MKERPAAVPVPEAPAVSQTRAPRTRIASGPTGGTAPVPASAPSNSGEKSAAWTAWQIKQAQTAVTTPAPTRVWERLALVAVDAIAINLAFYLAWYARYQAELVVELDPGNYMPHESYWPLQLALSVILLAILAARGLYRVPRAEGALDDFWTVLAATGLALMAVFAGSTFVRYEAESRLTLIFAWGLITLLVLVGRTLYLWGLGLLRSRGVGVSRALVVGDNTLGRMVMQALAARPHLGYAVTGFVGDNVAADFGRFRWLGRSEQVERVIQDERIAQVIIALPSNSHEAVMRIVDHCRRDGVQFRIVPDLYEMSLGRVDFDTVSGIPLIGLKDASIRGVKLLAKRAIDIVLAAILLVPLLPLFGILALAIKLDDRGPIFFGQTRVGRGGRTFTAWKLRSMRRGADALLDDLKERNEVDGPIFKMRDDPRRTRVGRFIRRWSLDELPQIWNVLRGEMSLIGPRPPTPYEVEQYDAWHLQRLEAPPGMTGLWQVSGRSELGFDEMVMLDITYIENWSLGLDLRILLRTIPAVLTGKGAF